MQGRKRTLTEPFEPNTNPFGDNAAVMTENVEDNSETDGNRLESKPQALVPPALNIVPPESSIHSTEEKKGDEYNGNDKDSSLISNIFRTRVGRSSHENLSRPKLSLKTASFGAAESSRRNVSPSTKSAKSSSQYIDLNDERLRRRSFSSYSRSIRYWELAPFATFRKILEKVVLAIQLVSVHEAFFNPTRSSTYCTRKMLFVVSVTECGII